MKIKIKKEAPRAVEATEGKRYERQQQDKDKNYYPDINGYNKLKPRRRNAPSDTRDESYLEILQGGTSITQEAKTFKALLNCSDPKNCRDLAIITGYEISAMNRVLFNLKEANIIYVADKKPSKHTNRRVEHYLVSADRTQENTTRTMTSEADTVIVSDASQASLFDNFGDTVTIKTNYEL